MGAFLKYDYKRGFVLAEESLVKIDDIIRKRIPTLAANEVVFRVFRDDGLMIDYTKPSDFVGENSLRSSSISEIQIAISVDNFKLYLRFPKSEDAAIRMETEDRDIAFLLSSDLKEYMASEVFKHSSWRVDRLTSKGATPFILLLLFALMPMFMITASYSEITLDQALNSNNVMTKLDFLLQKNWIFQPGKMFFLFGSPIILAILLVLSSAVSKYLYPKNVFYFGKEAEAFEKIKGVREKLLWGVLIALIVSVMATYIGRQSGLA